MDAFEIHERRIDDAVSVFFFARSYVDDRNSTASWGGIGGLALGPEGSRGPIRRPQG